MTPPNLERRMREDDDRPVIVGGFYRSGTSLVRRLLDSHTRIHCGPEVKFFRDFHADYLDVEDPIAHLRFMSTARSLLPEHDLLEILGAAFVKIHERAALQAGKPRWADKTPENLVFLDEWQRLLGGDWIFLHVVRNPLDTLASVEEWGFPKSVSASQEDRIRLYVKYAEAGLRFAEESPDRYVRLSYEDLVADPEAVTRRLMASLGEAFHPEQLAINATPHQPGLEDPKAGLASEIHGESVGRWRRVLSDEAAETIAAATEGVWGKLRGAGPI
jgi:hypothetical protein